MYEDKTKLKGVDGKEIEYLVSKNMINAAFGMMVTAIVRDEFDYDEEWTKTAADVDSACLTHKGQIHEPTDRCSVITKHVLDHIGIVLGYIDRGLGGVPFLSHLTELLQGSSAPKAHILKSRKGSAEGAAHNRVDIVLHVTRVAIYRTVNVLNRHTVG